MKTTMSFNSLSELQDSKSRKDSRLKSIWKRISSIKFLAFLIVLFQIGILYILVNPVNILNQLYSVQVINKVAKLTVIPAGELPSAMGTIGDNVLLPAAETLRKDNAIQAEVYKDARDGDYVIAYSNKMIIFRDSENRIIYEGSTPAALLTKGQEDIVKALIAKVKEAGIIPSSSEENPQLRVITNELEDLKRSNPDFYANAKENDIQAIFAKENKIILYRSEGNQIIKFGEISVR